MTMQWFSEREYINQQPIDGFSIDFDEFRQLMAEYPETLPTAFDDAVNWVIQQGNDISELKQRMTAVSDELELADFPDSVNLLMIWVWVEALAKNPSLQTWKNVRKLKSNSERLEYRLSDAMIIYAEKQTDAKETYIALAKEVFTALDNFELTSQFDRNNKEREQLREVWKENAEKLDEIWWGLRCSESESYREEYPLFQVLEVLAFDEFLAVVSKSKNPYLVNSVLEVGTYYNFSLWKKLADSAPSAFDNEGKWNDESVMMPLLLVTARDALLYAGHNLPYSEVTDIKITEIKQEITKLTKAVIATLSERKDALPLFARWSTWLMRQLLIQQTEDADNVRSSVFVDATLIEEIGRELKDKNIILNSPSDAPAWEAWCYRCVLASHAHNGFMAIPDNEHFLNEWIINLDDWASEKGKQLREHAALIMNLTKKMPSYAAQYLAYPIAMSQSQSPVDAWLKLWNDTQTLREIVEFGDVDTSESDAYKSRNEAGKLLLLVFCIGLAILDQRVSQCPTSNSPQARGLAKLHQALALAVQEMRETDDSLNREQWLQAVQHLAVRRLIWEDRIIEVKKEGQLFVFLPTDKPTFSDYLNAAKNDVLELLAVLQMTELNESDCKIVQNKIKEASIDLKDAINTIERLNAISASKYPITGKRLNEIKAAYI